MAKSEALPLLGTSDALMPPQRILRKLANTGSYLARIEGEDEAASPSYGLFSTKGRAASLAARIPQAVVEEMRRYGQLEGSEQRLTLSQAGRAWLRRQLAGADAFREQHQLRETRLIDMGGVKRPALIDGAESPLGWLRRRKDKNGNPLITAWQFEAGERLRAEFFRAQMTPRVTAAWDASASSRRSRRAAPGGAESLRDHVIAARQRVTRALDAVGPELADVLIDVCCHLKGLEEAEKAKGWPKRSGKVVLQIALTRLARHYGLISGGGPAVQARRRTQHWGTPDYRPSIQASN